MHNPKTTYREMQDFCFVGKLPFSPLMEIKSGLWFASADGRKPHFLHIWAEKRCAGPTQPAESACFKDQQGEWFSLCTLFLMHNALIGSSLWDCCEQVDCKLQPPVPHTTSSEAAARQKAPLITLAGWEVKHIQHVKIGLKSDWDESNWHQKHQTDERLTKHVWWSNV